MYCYVVLLLCIGITIIGNNYISIIIIIIIINIISSIAIWPLLLCPKYTQSLMKKAI